MFKVNYKGIRVILSLERGTRHTSFQCLYLEHGFFCRGESIVPLEEQIKSSRLVFWKNQTELTLRVSVIFKSVKARALSFEKVKVVQ